MTLHLASQRMLLPSTQVSALTTSSFTLPSARGSHVGSDFESIQTVALSSATTTVQFTSIPQTYKHLQLRFIARENSGAGTGLSSFSIRFNSDSATNYQWHYVYGVGSTTAAGESLSASNLYGWMAQNASQSNVYAGGVINIFDYSATNKHKTCFFYQGAGVNSTSSQIDYDSGCWRNTSAITQIDCSLGSSFKAYSHFALYGIKG